MPDRWDNPRWSGDAISPPGKTLENIWRLRLSGLYLGHKEPEAGAGAPVLVAQAAPTENITSDPDEFAFQAPLLREQFSFNGPDSWDAPDTTYFEAGLESLIGIIVFQTNGAVASGLFSTRDGNSPFGGYEVQLDAGGALLATFDDGPTQQPLALTAALNNNKWQTATVAILRDPAVNEFVLVDDVVSPPQVARQAIGIGSIPAGAVFAVGGSRIPVSVTTKVAMMAIFQGPQIDASYDARRLHHLHRQTRLALTSEIVIGQVL